MSERDYRVLQEAAQWFALLESGAASEAEHDAWATWMQEEAHARAWSRVERIRSQLQPLADEATGRAARSVLLRQPDRRAALKYLAVAGIGIASVLAGGNLPWRSWAADQRSRVGEVRDLALDEGSRLWLNTDSAVDIDFRQDIRALSLQRGELLLDVASDRRPLWLRSRDGAIRVERPARFSLQQRGDRSWLNVFSGAVELRLANATGTRQVAAGQRQAFSLRTMGALEAAQRSREAWSQGVLLADNQRLADFIAELARYCSGYLGCDPRVAELRVVGAFPLADTERVLAALAATLPVTINRRLPWWVSLEPAASRRPA
jgi:transmembrane sensor